MATYLEAHVLRFCSRTLKAAENFSAHIDLAFLFVLTETADEFQLVRISLFLYFAAIQHLIMLCFYIWQWDKVS